MRNRDIMKEKSLPPFCSKGSRLHILTAYLYAYNHYLIGEGLVCHTLETG